MTLHHGAIATGGLDDGPYLGLSESEVRDARGRFGSNTLPAARTSTLLDRVLGQLKDPMILLLIGAGAVTTALGDVVDTAVIALVVVLNSAIGVIQEGKAERSLAALEAISAPRATVVRAGAVVVVAASELVPGDIVHLRGGDIVPADIRLLEAHDLQIDEAALTGESLPVHKCVGETALSGTVVTRGRGTGEVSATGIASSLGQIASMVADAPRLATPLQRRLGKLSRVLVMAAGAVSGLVFLIGMAQGHRASEMLVVAVSLAVAAVPESLPAVVSVALAMGAYRMAGRSAIVRRLPAVETLGSVTVIASDKTGTLTENKMVADLLWVPNGFLGASLDCAYDLPTVGVVGSIGQTAAGIQPLMEAAVLCNDAHVSLGAAGSVMVSGDPLDAALVELALKSRVDVRRLRERVPRLSETPFDAVSRVMTTRHPADARRTLAIVKGAPEQVFALEGLRVTDEAVHASNAMADQGLRVLALAMSLDQTPPSGLPGKPSARLLGLIAIADPVRATSAGVVRACADAGVRVVMVTGDHPRTAAAVARQVGISGPSGSVVVADDLHTNRLKDHVDTVGVFARTRPAQKVEIVRALQEKGHIVAMTGDGVNDAPALRAADIGVAMGKRGTEVARQAAELVLADDDLRTVVAAIEEGRRITTNIRAFLRYALSGGAAEVLVMVVAPFLGMGIPLLPGQILWVNMLTHGLPGVAFGSQPADPKAMTKPSKSPDEFILGGGLWKQIVVLGVAISTVTLAAGAMALETGADVSTYVFLVLGLAQLGIAMSLRTRASATGWRSFLNPFTYAVGGAVVLQVLAVTLPVLQDLLRTSDVSLKVLISLGALACVPSMLVSFARGAGWLAEGPRSRQASSMAPEGMAEDSAEVGPVAANLEIQPEADDARRRF